jgi:hypothetical protein
MTDEEMIALSEGEPFTFACAQENSCFNSCCRDLNQFLTPYDVLRLARHSALSSQIFLSRYTVRHTGPRTGLPVVTLVPVGNGSLACPFLGPDGCVVYENRPSSCRIYPLVRVASRCRQTGGVTETFMLLKEPHCKGFENPRTWTARSWMENQGLSVYNEMNDALMSLLSLKNRTLQGPLPNGAAEAFYSACYDLDGFREELKAGKKECPDRGPGTPDPFCATDEELLLAAFRHVSGLVQGLSKKGA